MIGKHSLLPYLAYKDHIESDNGDIIADICNIHINKKPVSDLNRAIAETKICRKTMQANAEFIVRACNSHYELLEALKAAFRCLDSGKAQAYTHALVEQAINKTEGK